jgi:hypothetical protein
MDKFIINSYEAAYGGGVYNLIFHNPDPSPEEISRAAGKLDDRANYFGYRILSREGSSITIKIHNG